ncbi:MAG: DUF2249 domain-containing protein [Caldimonas sp.]
MNQAVSPTRIDVRAIAPRERHPLIFSTFRALGAAESMEIVNDHDPRPLWYQMQSEQPGRFAWEYLESGPDTWRVLITRAGEGHGNGSCCGSCGGS